MSLQEQTKLYLYDTITSEAQTPTYVEVLLVHALSVGGHKNGPIRMRFPLGLYTTYRTTDTAPIMLLWFPRAVLNAPLLTCVVLVPLEDGSKHLGRFVKCVFTHAIHPPKAEPEGAPRFLRSAMAQPISRLPLLVSATCDTAYDAYVCRCYTDLKRAPKLGSQRLQIFGPPVASKFLEIIWKNASLCFPNFNGNLESWKQKLERLKRP